MKHLKLYEEATQSVPFSQLAPKIQKEILDSYRENMVDGHWWGDVFEEIETELRSLTFEDVDIQFSGFYSQGDGASFTGEVREPAVFLKQALGLDLPPLVTDLFHIRVTRGMSRYVHENSVDFECGYDHDSHEIEDEEWFLALYSPQIYNLDEIQEQIETAGSKWLKQFCLGIYKRLEQEYDSLTSDENVLANLESLGVEWDSSGQEIN